MARKQLGSAPSGATDAATKGYVDTAQLVAYNIQTAAYTLVLTDQGKAIEFGLTTAVNCTIPTNASVAFPIGTVIEICQLGTSQVTIVGASGVLIRSADGLTKTRTQNSSVSIRKRATDDWILVGDLA